VTRTAALLRKELTELRLNPMLVFPAILTALISIFLPFFVAVIIPALTDERLSDSSDFQIVAEMSRNHPAFGGLDPEGVVQGWIFQQFLVLLVLAPVAASMAAAAYGIVGEKQGRTLEPLLATPLTTFELLAGKTLAAMLPALALTLACFAAYMAGVVALARPGVSRVLLTPASLSVVFVIGPLAALTALQMAVCVSSRVNDARSAQQIGAVVVLPVAALLIVQLTWAVQLTVLAIAVIAAGLMVVNVALMLLAIALFDRESILTRWT
jgi:ABC-2 type transport system permease protein